MQSSGPVSKALLRGISDLKKRLAIEDIPIAKLVQSAGDSLELILTDKLAGIENQYAKVIWGMGMPIYTVHA